MRGVADGAVALMHKLATGSARATDFTGPFKYTICVRACPLDPLATAIERELVSQEALAF